MTTTRSQPSITRTTHTLPFDKLSPRDLERACHQQDESERQAEHLFQTLLHRAFRGELGDPKDFGNP